MVPSTWYQVHDTWHQVLSTWYQVLGTWYQALGTWYQVLGARYVPRNFCGLLRHLMPLSRPDEVAGSPKQPVEESGIAALKITDLAPLSTTIFSTFSDLWASFSRNQALGKAPVAPQMADLASQDILRAPCGGVGEGGEDFQ